MQDKLNNVGQLLTVKPRLDLFRLHLTFYGNADLVQHYETKSVVNYLFLAFNIRQLNSQSVVNIFLSFF